MPHLQQARKGRKRKEVETNNSRTAILGRVWQFGFDGLVVGGFGNYGGLGLNLDDDE